MLDDGIWTGQTGVGARHGRAGIMDCKASTAAKKKKEEEEEEKGKNKQARINDSGDETRVGGVSTTALTKTSNKPDGSGDDR
ncbi:hypothetical protein CGRA01v4_03706 [Colletotrichum graminicola]|uniref:Uncharacterized protein n=1 Tax=Colletotrichum graminicola (strain M1.001 / M2 / FGSC 10212) TaxID=645133 RepID=E3QFU3_COLGM|nr:uncharacterized protein GLRG_04922 [Colletotrichum graminicola M1.001]EFQ29778.1 hypothetical protein GLRG_04922 [Colletotrichum graminicola M1.001]WDK12427.1 hypothetical protein CGRA01v4_03706 [Colletotrichum graminicola]